MENKINEDEFQNPFVFNIEWKDAFDDEEFVKVFSSDILENYIINKRWYGGKASTLKYIEVVDSFKITSKKNTYFGVLLEVNFKEAFYQHYFMPLSFMSEEELDTHTIIAPIKMKEQENYCLIKFSVQGINRIQKLNSIKELSLRIRNIKVPNLWE